MLGLPGTGSPLLVIGQNSEGSAMSQIMKPLTEARLSVIVYNYSVIDSSIIDDLLEELLNAYQSFTGKELEITATVQGPFAAYLAEVPQDGPGDEGGRSKRDFIVMAEEALNAARQPSDSPDTAPSPGLGLVRAMISAAMRSHSDVQLNYKSDLERRSVLLTKMDAGAIRKHFEAETVETPPA